MLLHRLRNGRGPAGLHGIAPDIFSGLSRINNPAAAPVFPPPLK